MDTRHIFGTVFGVETAIATAVFLLVLGAMLLAMWLARRRRRQGLDPSRRTDNRRFEIGYGVAVAAVSGFVVWLSIHTNNEIAPRNVQAATTVRVTGFQWCWRFDYPGNYPGHHVSVTGRCRGADMPTMVVPVGVPVTVETTGKDVIHSWWVPELRYKMDAFPDHTNRFTLTVTSAGRYRGRCAEYCGNDHWSMDFWLKAVPLAKYKQWLAAAAGAPA